MTTISIIIPIYNSDKYISRTIQSVIKQTYKDFELILVDDGSTDLTSEICKEFTSKDERIIFTCQKNNGVSSARNRGIELARGEWIYFLDSDDHIEKNFFEKISVYFNDTIDIIQVGTKRVKNSQIISYRQSLKNHEVKKITGFSDFIKTSNIGSLCVWLHIIRRQIIEDKNIRFSEDMQYNEDILFMYKTLVNIKSAIFVGETLHTQFLVSNSLSRSEMNSLKIKNSLMLVDRILDLVKDNSTYKEELIFEANILLKNYFGSLLSLYKNTSIDIKPFAKEYKNFYIKNKKMLNSFFSKIASVNLLIVILALDFKFLLRKISIKNKTKKNYLY
ncbi:glycosyl transferase [Advenella faeciporci]|uniref:Glycosyl transferase n=1 Tax=Advenella faeciporci TaxID=797535 RepID=A0A918JQG6_9BURK|nr:glycosyltransferase family 2 protein [Advenella faeciporci]GGW93409.1 glycosyl transferase [Advenella faeciporci]